MTDKYTNMVRIGSQTPSTLSGWLAVLLIITGTTALAQTGPGGVGNADGSNGQPRNILWLDASVLGETNGTEVTSWTDQSGNSYDAVGGSGTSPIFTTAVVGSHPVLRFDGTDDELDLPTAINTSANGILSSDYSFVIVAAQRTTTNNEGWLMGGSVNTNGQNLRVGWRGANRFTAAHWNDGVDVTGVHATTSANQFAIFSNTFDQGTNPSQYFYENGIQIGTNNTGILSSWNDASIGVLPRGNRFSQVDIAEIIFFKSALNEARRAIIENYLSAKYGITMASAANDYYAGDESGNGNYDSDVIGIGRSGGASHPGASDAGLVLQSLGTTLDADGEFVMAGHKTVTNAVTASNVDTGIEGRWERTWYVDKTTTGALGAVVGFDFGEGINRQFPGDKDNYVLLRLNGTTYEAVNIDAADKFASGDAIYFRVSDVDLTDGVYTLGTTNAAASPLVGEAAQTWYSYTNGNWNDPTTWTLDGAAIPAYDNSGNEIPDATDNVIITAGNRVTIQPTNNGLEVSNIEVIGDLDLTNSSGHNFNTITGNGNIRISGSGGNDNFPAGDATGFANPTNGGTVIAEGTGFLLNTQRTFNNVRIELTDSANEAVLRADYTINGALTIVQGTLRINDATNIAPLTATVYGNVNVEPNGLIRVSSTNTRHQWNLYGDFVNEGDVAFTNRTVANYNSEATDGIVDVNFLSSTQHQTIECDNVTRFYRIEIDKGINDTYQLHIQADQANYFQLLGFANQGHPSTVQLTDNANALGLIRGTARIGTNVDITNLNRSGNYNISAGAQLWVDGGSVTKQAGTAIVPYGTARVSAGTFSALVPSGFTLRDNGTVRVEGTGVLNARQIRTSVLGSGNVGGYIQEGGTANLLGGAIASDYYVFNLTFPGNVFTMTGGTLNIRQASQEGGILINSDPTNVNVTEGTVNVEIGDNEDVAITSRAPFYNLNLRTTTGNTGDHKIVLADAVDVSSSNVDLAAQPLVVLNNLVIDENTHFDANNQNVTVGRDFSIRDGALYEFGTNTTIFNSSNNATLFVGDITGVSNPSYTDPEGSNAYAQWEQPFYNMIVDKPGATLALATASTYSSGNLFHDGSGSKNIRGWRNNLVKIANDFALEAGTIDLDLYSVRLYGNLTNRGIFGTDFDPLNAQIKLRKEDTPVNRTIITEEGAEFGNLRFNSGQAVMSITSDVYVKRFEYKHGRLNLETHNIRIDRLDAALENEARFDLDGDNTTSEAGERRIFSPADMFITDGNASDGGVSILVDGNGSYELPFGIGTGATETQANGAKYTPATFTVSNFSDDGYITINPVDASLQTTNNSGGDLLSYYWRVRHSDFTVLPTVEYQFDYDQSDVDGSANETSFVAGKVLDEAPFTRSGEDFADTDEDGTIDSGAADPNSVSESNNTITFDGNSAAGFTLDQANYTAGEANRFTGGVRVFYSRMSSVDDPTSNNDGDTWNDTNTDIWTLDPVGNAAVTAGDLPITSGDIVVIRNGHEIFLNGSKVEAAELILDATNGSSGLVFEDASTSGTIQDVAYTSEFGRVVARATGTTTHVPFIQFFVDQVWTEARIDNNSFVLPQSDYGDFLNFENSGGELADVIFTYDDSGQNGQPAYLPDDIVEFPNMRFGLEAPLSSPNDNYTIVLPEADINVRGTLSLADGVVVHLSDDPSGDVTANVVDFLANSRLQFPGNSAAARTLTVDSLLKFTSNTDNQILDVRQPNTGALTHTLQVNGDITMQRGTFNLYNGDPATHTNVLLRFGGDTDAAFSRVNGPLPNLYRIEVNKAEEERSISINTNFSLSGPTNGSTKALELQHGILVLDDSNINIDLTTGGDDFLIPASAALEVTAGQVNVRNSDNGILLDGRLAINGGRVDLDNSGGNGNNYIEYSASGGATLEISAGELQVGSQIRRGLASNDGVLQYTQTGGTVSVGRRSAPESNRGVFEVVNGGRFVHRGGDLTIRRSNGSSPSAAALYLDPTVYDVSGSTITLGDGNFLGNQVYGINANIPLNNLVVSNPANNNSPEAHLFVRPLTLNGTLTIDDGATFNASTGGLSLTLNGDFENDGTYVPNGNVTTFSGSTAQALRGTTVTEFYDLVKENSGILTMSQAALVTHDLSLLAGTLADGGNTLTVQRNVINDATHTSVVGGQGVVLAGTGTQQLSQSVSGTSTFGILTINNANGVTIPESNGFNFNVTNQLRLQGGLFNIGSSSLTLGQSATIEEVSSFGASNMVQTNSSFADAGLRKIFPISHSSDFTFPVGEGTYTPATVTFSGSQNTGSTPAEVIVVPSGSYHPIVDDGNNATDPSDPENVLQHYWAVRTNNLSNFSGNIVFAYEQSDVRLGTDPTDAGDPFVEAEYIPARILASSTDVDKFSPTFVDEDAYTIRFEFSGVIDNQIYGDYFAGITEAIPDNVPIYTSTGTGDFSDNTIWTPTPPAGGISRSSRLVIQTGHTVTLDQDRAQVYQTEIQEGAILNVGATSFHDVGIVSGSGTIRTETGDLPAGLYRDFFTCAGGSIEYAGSTDYSILKGGVTNLRNLILTGTGERSVPNVTSINICTDLRVNGPLMSNDNNTSLSIGRDLLVEQGTMETGSGAVFVGRNTLVQGVYAGQSGHTNTIAGNLTVDGASASFQAGGNSTINLGGNLTYTSGSFDANAGSSIIVMQGSTAQSIAGDFTGAAELNRLQINNGAGVSLGAATNVDIATELVLTEGLITPGTNRLKLDIDATANPKIGRSNSFVNGRLYKDIANGDGFTFPIGKGNRWGYASVSGVSSGPHEWNAEYFDAPATSEASIGNLNPSEKLDDGQAIETVSQGEYWRIEDDATGTNAEIGLMWDGSSDVSANASDWYELKVMVWNSTDSDWDTYGGKGHDSNPPPSQNHGFFSSEELIGFSTNYLTLGSTTTNNALPVELITFKATAQAQTIQLTWETASEIDNDYFEVQRSVDGIDFKKIGEVAGNGTTNQAQQYQFEDKLPLAGIAYYRLKQVDYNGMYDHSDAVSVEWINDGALAAFVELELYPNPAPQGKAKLRVSGLQPRSMVTVKLIDMFGKTYLQQVIESDQLTQKGYMIQPRVRLGAGVYVVSVQQGSQVHQKTLIVR